ncbi:dehydrogenase/reductase SDR family member 7 isoform X3 [Rhodamnia argentea]|uniref:Dehydrogenase/reductase SDR family member 7 isoform X3 n=1 Tax=Rhodamnia argentea TaxID=178133 RepID=A0A8B8Q0W7_9MYRT|nr:dehydrogenase/reductase SDR family member 7 isoform X3 [Rhodamnia argentea]
MMILLFLLFLGISALLFKFITADGDFTLMSKKHVKRDEIEDKVVWITGASRGIGEILAKQLANLGAKLILSARNEAELERVKAQLTGKHAPNEVQILPLDLASGEDSLRQAVEKAESFFARSGVDIMIHNAAFERPKSTALDVTEESLQATFDVNVFGTLSLTRLLAPFMLRRGRGQFVVLCQKGIKVTVVCPGPIETSNGSGATTSTKRSSSEKRVSSERCAELTIIAASHGLKEAWISYQPVLAVMYLVQYMPTMGYFLMDKIGGNRLEAAAKKGNTYSLGLIFGKRKAT